MIIKNLTKNFYINLLIIFSIFIIDRISKIYVINFNIKNLSTEVYTSKFLNINLIWNEGIAFGLFSFDESHFYNFLTILITIITVIIFFMILKNSGFKKYSFLMIFGGALGNLYDRIFFKAVPDFIDFHIGNFHWFIFNVADIFITLGIMCLILAEFLFYKKIDEKK